MPCALYPAPSPCNIIPCNPPSKSLFRHFSVLEKYAVCMLDFLKWYCDFRRKSLAVSSSFFFFPLSAQSFWTLHPDACTLGLSLVTTVSASALGACSTFLIRAPSVGTWVTSSSWLPRAVTALSSCDASPESQGIHHFTPRFVWSFLGELSLSTLPPAMLRSEVPIFPHTHRHEVFSHVLPIDTGA